jgi:protein-S-isoprenylcysteine O-methyltransferase Ste14
VTGNLHKPARQKISGGTWGMFAFLGALLLASVVGFWVALNHGVIPHISMHGWIAMSVGVVFSLLLGCGLMWLSFYSSRQGFDDRADPGRLKTRSESKID